MSVAGILSTAFSALSSLGSQQTATRRQQFQQSMQQLGQDLQAGNLSAAQTDFAAVQQLLPQKATTDSSSTSSTSSTDSAKTSTSSLFSQLATDLQAGNLSAAQQDYAAIRQSVRSGAAHSHHPRHQQSSKSGQITETLNDLGQALQSGDLSSAQRAYSTFQQEFSQLTDLTGSQAAGQALNRSISLTA